MPIKWDAEAAAYWDTETEAHVDEQRVRALAAEERAFTNERAITVMDEYSDGQMGAAEVERQMRELIKGGSIRQYMISRGGAKQMGRSDYGVIGRRLRDQYGYLSGFMNDLESLTPGQRRARAQLYISATHYLYERGRTKSLGIPKLPCYPADGNTPCKSNCRCRWNYRRLAGSGNWDVQYINMEGNICLGCKDRAAKYAPLRVRGGKIEREALPQAA